MKLLSIIVPTYNMAAFLPHCLESVMNVADSSCLDVMVVNDGSKDNSLEIARDWEMKYPSVIRVIDKKNGNYGSTINAALPLVEGKYVKILDSDDSFDTQALERFLEKLRTMESEGICPDVIQTPFVSLGPDGVREVVRYNTMGKEPFEYGTVYSLDEVLSQGYIRSFLIHGLTYRFELLKSIDYHQLEGVSYTDTEWSCYPFFFASDIMFLNIQLYLYNADREGQTMNPAVLMKSLSQLTRVIETMISYYQNHAMDESVSETRRNWLKQNYSGHIRNLYKLYLLDMPRSSFNKDEMEKFDAKFSSICRDNGFNVRLIPANKLLRIDYISYWHKYHSRWPVWLESFNHFLDIVTRFVYVRLFRN